MKYIDFDDVIKATGEILFSDYARDNGSDIESEKVKYIQQYDWEELLRISPIINNAIEIIKSMDDVAILTKTHSLNNEGVAKIRYLRSIGVDANVILVPYYVKKTEVVVAKGNILVDDNLYNLDDWYMASGIPIFFDKFGNNYDGYGRENKKYVRTRTLEILKNY